MTPRVCRLHRQPARVMSHVCMSHVTYIMSHVTLIMSHVLCDVTRGVSTSQTTSTRVTSHVCMSRVTYIMNHATCMMSHVTYTMSHVPCDVTRGMSTSQTTSTEMTLHVSAIISRAHWFVSHVQWISRVPYACDMTLHMAIIRVPYVVTVTYEWVMSHISE